MPKDNPGLKKIVEEFDGKPAEPARMKQAQESLEVAIVQHARAIVDSGGDSRATFDKLVKLYDSQPNLNVRTSTSIENQAYSTPAPLAFLADKLAGVDKSVTVYEPTAGNGMLLIAADPKKAIVNELNADRVAGLKSQGFRPIHEGRRSSRLTLTGQLRRRRGDKSAVRFGKGCARRSHQGSRRRIQDRTDRPSHCSKSARGDEGAG
jgi:hypothetical protein